MAAAAAAATSSSAVVPEESTIDESVCKTILRDFKAIGRNLLSVLIPINWRFSNQEQALRNWDLWGPLVSGAVGQGGGRAGERRPGHRTPHDGERRS